MKVGNKEIEAPPWKYKRRCEDIEEKRITQAKTLRERLMINEPAAMKKMQDRCSSHETRN